MKGQSSSLALDGGKHVFSDGSGGDAGCVSFISFHGLSFVGVADMCWGESH